MKETTLREASISVAHELVIPKAAIKRWILSEVINEFGLATAFVHPSDLQELIQREGYLIFLEDFDPFREVDYEQWEHSQDEALAATDKIMNDYYATDEDGGGFPHLLLYSYDAAELEYWLEHAVDGPEANGIRLAQLTQLGTLALATHTRVQMGDESKKEQAAECQTVREHLRAVFPFLYLT